MKSFWNNLFVLPISGCVLSYFPTSYGNDEPGAAWVSSFGWASEGEFGYVSGVLTGPDKLPIGVEYQAMNPYATFGVPGKIEPDGPCPCCFQGAGWVLWDNLGYSARLVLGPDRGLVGISFRIWNNSLTNPLTVTRHRGTLPFLCKMRVIGGKELLMRNKNRRLDWIDKNTSVDFVLPPRGREEVFVPIRDLLPENFQTEVSYGYQFELDLNVLPKGLPVTLHAALPSFTRLAARITDTSLAIDPQAALKQAEARQEVVEAREDHGEIDWGSSAGRRHPPEESVGKSGPKDRELLR